MLGEDKAGLLVGLKTRLRSMRWVGRKEAVWTYLSASQFGKMRQTVVAAFKMLRT